MHTENRNTAVNYFHTIKSCDKSDGSAAANVNLTKLSSLEANLMVVKNSADSCNILSIGIIGSGFSTGTCKLVENNTSSKISRVLFLKSFCKCRIIAGTYI